MTDLDRWELLKLHEKGLKELKHRLNDKELAAEISAPTLIRLVAETAKLLISQEREPQAPKVQNNYLALIASADGLPDQKKREILARIGNEASEVLKALEQPKGARDGE